jgi:hypothetical protein
MDFNAQQMREDALVKKGRYCFRVLQAREKRSSNGNDMMILKMMLDVNGRPTQFYCTLLFMPKMFWLVEHFCHSTGMAEKIEEGRLMAQDCDGREGVLDIDHRVNKETGEVEAYVKDCVKPEDLEAAAAAGFDDDIPNM